MTRGGAWGEDLGRRAWEDHAGRVAVQLCRAEGSGWQTARLFAVSATPLCLHHAAGRRAEAALRIPHPTLHSHSHS